MQGRGQHMVWCFPHTLKFYLPPCCVVRAANHSSVCALAAVNATCLAPLPALPEYHLNWRKVGVETNPASSTAGGRQRFRMMCSGKMGSGVQRKMCDMHHIASSAARVEKALARLVGCRKHEHAHMFWGGVGGWHEDLGWRLNLRCS